MRSSADSNEISYTFAKSERLCLRKSIEELFQKGSSFFLFPYKVHFLVSTSEQGQNEILVSIPKRKFKKAVDRNLLKRRTKEAFRLHKSLLEKTSESSFLQIAFVYVHHEILEYVALEKSVVKALKKLSSSGQPSGQPLRLPN